MDKESLFTLFPTSSVLSSVTELLRRFFPIWSLHKTSGKFTLIQMLFLPVEFVKKSNGKILAIIDGYTFYCQRQRKDTERWVCTVGSGKCTARFTRTTSDGTLDVGNTDHPHKPPVYRIINGIYLKV